MAFSGVIGDVEIITDVTAEPVSLPELKRHLNMLFETDGAYEFDDDDVYLLDIITQARGILEKFTGLSFAPKELRVVLSNPYGGVKIPGAPIMSISVVKDMKGTVLSTPDGYGVMGNTYKSFSYPLCGYIDVQYTAGYEAGKLPAQLKRAILEQCQFMYDNRGAQKQSHQSVIFDISSSARQLAGPYSQNCILA